MLSRISRINITSDIPLQRWLAVAFMTGLVSCAGPTVIDTGNDDPVEIPRVVDADEETLQLLLAEAAAASSPQKESLLYQAALLLNSLDRRNDAILLLDTLDTTTLPLELATDIQFLQGRLLAESDQTEAALALLTDPRLQQLPRLPDNKQMSIHLFRGEIYAETGMFLESAQERILADKLLPLRMVPLNHEQIWNALIALDTQTLRTLADQERRYEFQGWYELASSAKPTSIISTASWWPWKTGAGPGVDTRRRPTCLSPCNWWRPWPQSDRQPWRCCYPWIRWPARSFAMAS